jgi:hypothetical protein
LVGLVAALTAAALLAAALTLRSPAVPSPGVSVDGSGLVPPLPRPDLPEGGREGPVGDTALAFLGHQLRPER